MNASPHAVSIFISFCVLLGHLKAHTDIWAIRRFIRLVRAWDNRRCLILTRDFLSVKLSEGGNLVPGFLHAQK